MVMNIPVQSGVGAIDAGKISVKIASASNLRAQIVGWALIGTLIGLVALTITCYSRIA
jgi:hypothetical protein